MESLLNKIFTHITEWKSLKGYFLIIIAAIIICTILNVPKDIKTGLIFVVLTIIWTIIWFIGSARFVIPSSKKTIVISFAVDSEGIKNYKRILTNLERNLTQLNLLDNIRIIVGAPDLIKNNDRVNDYRRNNRVDLVVWGKSIYGNLDSKKILKFEVNHTCAISPKLNDKLQLFLADLTFILQRRKWVVEELNELADVQIVADDLLETCLFIISIFLFIEEDLIHAARILELILPIFDKKAVDTKDEIRNLQSGRVRAILMELYFFQAKTAHDDSKHTEAINILLKIKPLVPNKIPVLMMLARSYYLAGDVFNAQKHTNELRSIDKKHPAVFINSAFFGIIQKNYERVRFWYDEVLKLNAIRDVDILSVVIFLDIEYKKNPSEHAFLYALGIVNGYIDPTIRKTELIKFMRLTKDRIEYLVLRRRALELLK